MEGDDGGGGGVSLSRVGSMPSRQLGRAAGGGGSSSDESDADLPTPTQQQLLRVASVPASKFKKARSPADAARSFPDLASLKSPALAGRMLYVEGISYEEQRVEGKSAQVGSRRGRTPPAPCARTPPTAPAPAPAANRALTQAAVPVVDVRIGGFLRKRGKGLINK